MTEHWTTEDWHEYQRTKQAPSRDRATRAAADVEPAAGDASVAAHEVPPFDSLVRVTFVSIRARLADADGISGKAALDGVVACGILRDDSAEFVQSVEHRQEKGKREETRIVIEEV